MTNFAQPPSTARGLVRTEMEPLLLAERKRCEKAAADLEQLTERLEKSRTEWEPAFSKWFHGLFGKKVTRVRELELRTSELADLISAVEYEAFVSQCSMGTAHERVERMRQAPPREEPLDFETLLRQSFEEFYDPSVLEPEEAEILFEDFRRNFRDETEEEPRKSRSGQQRRREPAQAPAAPDPQPDPQEARLKALYRGLARRLHPDSNPKLTPRERELWHEVQAAYDTRNLDALETLAALVEGDGAAGYLKIRSVARLRAILAELQSQLRAARKSLRHAQKQPFWNFEEVEGDPLRIRELRKRMENELDAGIRGLEAEVLEGESYVESWGRRTKSRRRT